MRVEENKTLGSERHPRVGSFALILLAAIALLAAGPQGGPPKAAKPPEAEAPKGNAESGKQLYTSSGCYECHGRQGQGSRFSGPRIGPDPIPFPMFVKYLRAPRGQMPPYTGKVLTDVELADIHAFLSSLSQPPAAKTIPLLN